MAIYTDDSERVPRRAIKCQATPIERLKERVAQLQVQLGPLSVNSYIDRLGITCEYTLARTLPCAEE